jgi:selenide,water dikinase
VSLFSHCTSGGCGAKIGPGELSALLSALPGVNDPRLLVGFDGRDDAAVYALSGEEALVSTVDFFPPVVNDPALFGRIAAANALSDIYAMGGRPLFALNLVCFPQALDPGILKEILAGGAEKTAEAGIPIAGGHSIYDREIKYGLAVTGLVHPGRILRNAGCEEGDVLILTKALGTGIILTALRAGKAGEESIQAAAASMERLNREAGEKLARFRVHACTDVTGFGLLVHAAEMAGETHSLHIEGRALPLLPGALDLAEKDFTTGGGQRNRRFLQGKAAISKIPPALQEAAFDPQTSGGLLIACAPEDGEALLEAIRRDDPPAAIIGTVSKRGEFPVTLTG